jgi:hypothetical protein
MHLGWSQLVATALLDTFDVQTARLDQWSIRKCSLSTLTKHLAVCLLQQGAG